MKVLTLHHQQTFGIPDPLLESAPIFVCMTSADFQLGDALVKAPDFSEERALCPDAHADDGDEAENEQGDNERRHFKILLHRRCIRTPCHRRSAEPGPTTCSI